MICGSAVIHSLGVPMRQFLLASAMALAAPLLIASGAQAAPMLGLIVQSDGASSFQSVALGSNGGSYNFAPVSVGSFTANNIGLGSSTTASAVTDGSFALTEVTTIMTTGSMRLSLDASVSNVPEPCRSRFSGRALPASA